MNHGDEISEHEALNYFPGWGDATRIFVREEIARIGAVRFRVNNTKKGYWNSLQVLNEGGAFIADLLKTKIWYVPELAPPHAEDEGAKNGLVSVMLEGVTRANRSERAGGRREPQHPPVCADCNLTHSGPECDW